MSDVTRRIRTAGYWDVAIHPKTFVPDRVRFPELRQIIENAVVEVRGWDFPHIDRNNPPTNHIDFIEQESEWQYHAERWRFYQSGQFTLLRALAYDWRDRSQVWPQEEGWRSGSQLGIGDTLFTLFEIYEFAAHLSNTVAGETEMRVRASLSGLRGRVLVVDDPHRWGFHDPGRATIEAFTFDRVLTQTELMASPDTLATASAQDLFARFGRDVTADFLRDWLSKLRR